MPTRLVREGILTSDKIDKLSEAGEVFYRRLLNKVDDHGLFDGRLSVLRAALYPLRIEQTSENTCLQLLAECLGAELVSVYEVDGKRFVQVLNTKWKVRSEPRFKTPKEATVFFSCEQLLATVSLVVTRSRCSLYVDEVQTKKGPRETKRATKPKKKKTDLPDYMERLELSERLKAWCERFEEKQWKARLISFVGYVKANGKQYVDWDQAFINAMRDDWAQLKKAGL